MPEIVGTHLFKHSKALGWQIIFILNVYIYEGLIIDSLTSTRNVFPILLKGTAS